MTQGTKLFVVLLIMFLLYTTMKGDLQKYLSVIFG